MFSLLILLAGVGVARADEMDYAITWATTVVVKGELDPATNLVAAPSGATPYYTLNSYTWTDQSVDYPMSVVNGDNLVFSWTGTHTLKQFETKEKFEACDFTGATDLTPSSGTTTKTVTVPGDVNSPTSFMMYFACSVTGHCTDQGGMKIAIQVGKQLCSAGKAALSVSCGSNSNDESSDVSCAAAACVASDFTDSSSACCKTASAQQASTTQCDSNKAATAKCACANAECTVGQFCYEHHGRPGKVCANSKKEELSECADSTARTKITALCKCGVSPDASYPEGNYCYPDYFCHASPDTDGKKQCRMTPKPEICASTDPIKFPADDKQSMRSGECVCGSGMCYSGSTCTKDSTCACEPSATQACIQIGPTEEDLTAAKDQYMTVILGCFQSGEDASQKWACDGDDLVLTLYEKKDCAGPVGKDPEDKDMITTFPAGISHPEAESPWAKVKHTCFGGKAYATEAAAKTAMAPSPEGDLSEGVTRSAMQFSWMAAVAVIVGVRLW